MAKDSMPMTKTLCQCKMTKWHLMGWWNLMIWNLTTWKWIIWNQKEWNLMIWKQKKWKERNEEKAKQWKTENVMLSFLKEKLRSIWPQFCIKVRLLFTPRRAVRPSSNTIPIAVSSLRAASAAAQSLAARASLRCLMSASILRLHHRQSPLVRIFLDLVEVNLRYPLIHVNAQQDHWLFLYLQFQFINFTSHFK